MCSDRIYGSVTSLSLQEIMTNRKTNQSTDEGFIGKFTLQFNLFVHLFFWRKVTSTENFSAELTARNDPEFHRRATKYAGSFRKKYYKNKNSFFPTVPKSYWNWK